MLLEEGKLHLEDPIARWLPEFANPRVLDDPDGPLENTHPAARPITVLDLLTHRPGIVSRFSARGPIARASA
jgi:CubicO group peptidase (beta-lactamase class C family)